MKEETKLKILIDVAKALHYLYGKEEAHYGVLAQNVYIDKECNAKLDFG